MLLRLKTLRAPPARSFPPPLSALPATRDAWRVVCCACPLRKTGGRFPRSLIGGSGAAAAPADGLHGRQGSGAGGAVHIHVGYHADVLAINAAGEYAPLSELCADVERTHAGCGNIKHQDIGCDLARVQANA